MKYLSIIFLTLLPLSFLHSCKKEQKKNEIPPDLSTPPTTEVKTIISGYEIIWGMDFLPNGDLLFAEKRGKLYRKSNEIFTEITGFPAVLASGQGGLLDIRIHPDYVKNAWAYASYCAASSEGTGSQLNLIRFKINNNQIQNIENLFSTKTPNKWYGHNGSRIVFENKNGKTYLYLSIGEGGTGTYGGANTNNKNAQDTQSTWGKIHRFLDNGSVPSDNPILPGNTTATSLYSYGHRNPQGLAIHPTTGELWETEHGPSGGDEVNIITKGNNFGWPTYCIGKNYDGTTISGGNHTALAITAPIYSWTPCIAPCGIAFITSNKFKLWKGNLLVSGLASQKLHRCVLGGNKIIEETILLQDSGRVRNVIQAPDGSVLVSVEKPGRIIQITPK